MSEPIVIALITTVGGILGSILGASFGRKPERGPHSTTGRAMWFLLGAGVGLGLALLGFAIGRLGTGDDPTDLSITSPHMNATVSEEIDVRGTWSGVGDDDAPRLVIFVQKLGRFYPVDQMLDLDAGGAWSTRGRIGNESDSGKESDIIVTTSDPKAQASLDPYLQNGRATGDWPGLPELPEGVTRHQTVTVTRE